MATSPLPNNDASNTQSLPAAHDEQRTAAYDGPGLPVGLGPPLVPSDVGTLGPYRLVKELGRGGMGVVYAALDTRLERLLAIKIMLPVYAADGKAKERFLREARAVAKITHDNVVTVYEADERNGIPYIAMQYLDGHTLDTFLKTQRRATLTQLLRIGIEIAHGLAAAHQFGLVHRDIKPANLWLEVPSGRVKILDFGLAKPVAAVEELTASGAVVGTPNYMSPEQARGEHVDHRSDLFSLGVVLYRLAAGQLPFQGATTMAVLMALGTEEPPSVDWRNPDLPSALAQLIQQLLAKRAEDRPPSAADVAQRLQAIADIVPTEANPFTDFDTIDASADANSATEVFAAKPPRRRRLGVVLGVGLVAVLVVVGVVFAFTNRPEPNNAPSVESPEKPIPPSVTVDPKVIPKKPLDHDRFAATWVIQHGGKVQVNGDDTEIDSVDKLPPKFTLTVINFYRVTVTDTGFEFLKDLTSLKELILSNTEVSDAVLVHIKDLKSLTGLWLQNTKVTDNGLVYLKNLHGLTQLVLTGTAVKDAGLVHLSGLTNLTGLQLSQTGVTNAGLPHLKNLKNLISLSLQSNAVTDSGLIHLKELPNLKELMLSVTGVTDNGLQHVKELKNLTGLWLSGVKGVTDQGLLHLRELKQLQQLHLHNTMVTDKGVRDLHDTLPKCKIDYNGGIIPAKE